MGESNRSKNLKLASWDGGDIWYLQVYDADTVISLDNSGFIKFDPDIEVGDKNVYNTTTSRLWSKVLLLLENDIKTAYAEMRQNGLTLDNILECIIEEQIDKIPATYYNKDTQTKYLDFGASYLYALHGNDKQHIKLWLEERLLYLDTLWDYDASVTDFVSLRSSKLGSIYMDIETFRTMYLKVKWRNDTTGASTQKLRVVKNGEPTRFSFESKTNTDQEIRIYGGQYIKSLGDLSNLEPTTITLIKASKINSLVCHSEQLINTDVSSCVNLSRVDLSDCANLGSGTAAATVLDVSSCTELQYLNIQNTALQGIQLNPKGSNIKEIWFPISVQSISLNNCPQLTTVGLTIGHNCNELKLINCPKVESFGDRNYVESRKDYTYRNSYLLNGVQELYLDNSCLSFDEWEMKDCSKGFTTITLKNMTNLKKLFLGVNNSWDDIYYDIAANFGGKNLSDLLNKKDCKIELINTNITELSVTALQRKSYSPLRYGIEYDYSGIYNTYHMGCFSAKSLDLSNTKLEKISFLCCSDIYNLLVPNTLKDLIVDSFFDMHNDFYSQNANAYNIGFENHHYQDGKDNLILSNGTRFNSKTYGIGSWSTGNYIRLPNACGGSTIWKVWCPNNVDEPSNLVDDSGATIYTWNLKGLSLNTCWLWNLNSVFLAEKKYSCGYGEIEYIDGYYGYLKNMYNEYKIQIHNMNLKCKDYQLLTYPRAFYIDQPYVNCTVDYTEFTGMALNFGFAYTKNLNYILPEDLESFVKNPTYIYRSIYKTESDIIGWNLVAAVNKRTTSVWQLRDIIQYATLKEQTEEEAIDLNIYLPSDWYSKDISLTNTHTYSILYGSNLKYLNNITIKGYFRIRGLFAYSNLVKINNIDITVSTTTDNDSSGGLFTNCLELITVGNINITFPDTEIITVGNNSGQHMLLQEMFANCPKLVSIGDITGNRSVHEVYQLLNSSNVNIVDYATGTCKNCTSLENIGDWSYSHPSNIENMLYNCTSLKNIKKLPNLSRMKSCAQAFYLVNMDLELNGLDENVESVTLDNFFTNYKGKNITGMYIPINTTSVRSMYYSALNLISVKPEGFFVEGKHDNSPVTSMATMCVNCRGELLPVDFIVPKKVTSMQQIFDGVVYTTHDKEHEITIKVLGSKLQTMLSYGGNWLSGITTITVEFKEIIESELNLTRFCSTVDGKGGKYFKNLNINWDKLPKYNGSNMCRDNNSVINLNYYDLNSISAITNPFYNASLNITWYGTASHDLPFGHCTITKESLTALIPLLEEVESAKLYLGGDSKNNLTTEQKAEITSKGWTIV